MPTITTPMTTRPMTAMAECRREPIAVDPLVEKFYPQMNGPWDRPLPVAAGGTSTFSSPAARRWTRGGRPRGCSPACGSAPASGATTWW